MKISGRHYRTIWPTAAGAIRVIDQCRLPFEFATIDLNTLDDAAQAIRTMVVRGAPLIGATAAYGIALALRSNASDAHLDEAARILQATRPTAHNLVWALTRMRAALAGVAPKERADVAFREAALICDADVEQCRSIGVHGLEIIRRFAETAGRRVNILTHCNAGWLACVDWGTALSPIYMAHDAGTEGHTLVDETRPRNQGSALTAFELGAHGVPHTVIADNLGGHLMQRGQVDMVIVGTDRTTTAGDVCNKAGGRPPRPRGRPAGGDRPRHQRRRHRGDLDRARGPRAHRGGGPADLPGRRFLRRRRRPGHGTGQPGRP